MIVVKERYGRCASIKELSGWERLSFPFKAGESKLTFPSMSKALANMGILSKITQVFFHTEREMSPGPCLWPEFSQQGAASWI